jgi:alanine dehydrogenase
MKIGVPKEIKNNEFRVGLTPDSVSKLVDRGHVVQVETQAGIGIGQDDTVYEEAGAKIVGTAEEIFSSSELIVKVKEPQSSECRLLSKDQLLFTYLHLAPDPEQTRLLVESGVTAIAYETVTAADNSLPLLTPMSEVAGRLSIQAGAACLEKSNGGAGILLGGVTNVAPAKVVIIGGGVVGTNAATIAIGMCANVTIIDKSEKRLAELKQIFGDKASYVASTTDAISQHCLDADLLIGGVLVPGAEAPKLITREHIASMKAGSVVVDVAIDQGGCFETSRATTHADPTYVIDEVIHYCVANMPGAVPRTSTYALNNATLPFVIALADKGWQQALVDDAHLMNGLNVHNGLITNQPVAEALNYEYTPVSQILNEELAEAS